MFDILATKYVAPTNASYWSANGPYGTGGAPSGYTGGQAQTQIWNPIGMGLLPDDGTWKPTSDGLQGGPIVYKGPNGQTAIISPIDGGNFNFTMAGPDKMGQNYRISTQNGQISAGAPEQVNLKDTKFEQFLDKAGPLLPLAVFGGAMAAAASAGAGAGAAGTIGATEGGSLGASGLGYAPGGIGGAVGGVGDAAGTIGAQAGLQAGALGAGGTGGAVGGTGLAATGGAGLGLAGATGTGGGLAAGTGAGVIGGGIGASIPATVGAAGAAGGGGLLATIGNTLGLTSGQVLSGAGSLVNAGLGVYAANKAAGAQIDSANQSNALLEKMYDTTRADNLPALQARNAGLAGYQNLLKDPSSVTSDPGYKFGLDQGIAGYDNSGAARGMRLSGGQAKALTRFGTDYGTTKYDNALGRYGTLAGIGAPGAGTIATAAGNYGTQASQNITGAGNAAASGYIGGANAVSGGVNNFLRNYQDSELLRRIGIGP